MVLDIGFGRMILHITFYRNTISFSVNNSLSSAYSALSDTIRSHFCPRELLRTWRVIEVTVRTCICISY